jgi:NADH:ubiquinone oxidoreductase subunit 2 (subunit N)
LVDESSYITAVFAMITAAIAAFFYLRLVVVMYTSADDRRTLSTTEDVNVGGGSGVAVLTSVQPVVLPFATALAIGFSVVLTVAIGVLPDGKYMIDAVEFAKTAAGQLFVSASSSLPQ